MDANTAAQAAKLPSFFGDTHIVSKNTRKLRLRGLVAATTIALAAQSALAAGAQPAPRVDLSAIQSGTQFDRFIVKYREGTPEAANTAALSRALQTASGEANQLVQASRMQRGDTALAAGFALAFRQ